MKILFIVIFILSAQLVHAVATDQRAGYNPYPFGTTIICMMMHPLLLISGIYYLGWIWGIVLFLCHLFGIVHGTVSWLLAIPSLLVTNMDQVLFLMKNRLRLLGPCLIINLAFTIISFFFADFKCLLNYLMRNTNILIISAVVVIILSIARIIVFHALPDE
ncbi:MAG: hypothetical protein IIV13_00880 [Bacteroidaceae bacterium]|nr:hypothetical protein [Bacteroidaceae bacterium]